MFKHALSPTRLKSELWLGIMMMLFLAACSDCGGCGGLSGEGQNIPPQRSCQAAAAFEDVGRGVSFFINMEELSADLTFKQDSCVSVEATTGSDFFYKANVPPNYRLYISVSNYNGALGNVYVFTDCEDAAGTCLAGVESHPSEQYTQLVYVNTTETPQTLIIGLDSSSSTGTLDGVISVDKVDCLPGEQRCDEAEEAIEHCNKNGTYTRYTCDGLCQDGRCETPSGSSCVDAIKLEGDLGTIEGDWLGGVDRFRPKSHRAGQCLLNENATFKGREVFYSVDLKAGEFLSVELTTPSFQPHLFLLEDCHDPETCLAYGVGERAKTLQYYAEQDRTVYLVVDNEERQEFRNYELSWLITAGKNCAPDQTRCIDKETAAYCNSSGTEELTYRCEQGCDKGACQITAAEHDRCETVASGQAIGQGISVAFDVSELTNDINEQLGCADNKKGEGRELFYQVKLGQEEIVEVSARGWGRARPLIYAFTDCDEVDATCVAGAHHVGDQDTANMFYQNKTGRRQTLIIAIDSSLPNAEGMIYAQINKLPSECEPRSAKCARDTLLTCNAQQRYVRYECTQGCTDGRCDNAKGDVCLDAIALIGDEGTIKADWRDGTDTFSPQRGYLGQCYISYDTFLPRGAEDFYRIDLQEGDLLNVNLAYEGDGELLFLLESCLEPEACVQSTQPSTLNQLRYYARSAITLYIVADQWNDEASEDYELSWYVTHGHTCAPQQSRCIDAMTAGKCNADGSAEVPIPCSNGCDRTGCAPDLVTQDSCAAVAGGAQTITGSLSAYIDIGSATPSLPLPTSEVCPFSSSTDQLDLFYKVTLAANNSLRARARAIDLPPSIYLFESCNDSSGSCVASNAQKETLEYINTTGVTQTLLLGVAARKRTEQGAIELTLDISPPQCEPGAAQCDPNGRSLLYCDHLSTLVPIHCEGGCKDGACVKPRGDYCADAIPLMPTNSILTGRLSGRLNEQFNNSYELDLGYSGACYLDRPYYINEGHETFYSIQLYQGDELIIRSKDTSFSTELFLLTDCASPHSCVASLIDQDQADLRYFATHGQKVIIAVDNNRLSATQPYEFEWGVVGGVVCAAGTTTCLDPNTVSYCSLTGQSSAAATCINGCFQGGCQAQAALQDVCSDVLAAATDVGAGLAIYARYEDFTNSVAFTNENPCAGGTTPGRDLFYKVNLAAGEVVRVSAQGYGSNNPIVYIIEDCSLSASSCLAGAREQSSSDAATTSYANTTGMSKTVLVGIDSSLSSPTGPVKATIERLSPECTPGEQKCATDGRDLLQCSPQGLYERVPCEDRCVNKACVTP